MHSHFLLVRYESLDAHLNVIDSLGDNPECLVHSSLGQIY